MKLQFNQTKQLIKHLTFIKNVINNKDKFEILNNVLIKSYNGIITNGIITITGGELNTQITLHLDAIVLSDIDITVNCYELLNAVKSLENKEFILDVIDNKLTMTQYTNKITLDTLPAEHYPQLKDVPDTNYIYLGKPSIYDELFDYTAKNDHRVFLCGALLEVANNNLTFVATDAHRLIKSTSNLSCQTNDCKIILPRTLIKLMPKLDDYIHIWHDDGTILVKNSGGDIIIKSKLIEGQFPDYRRVIPTNNDKSIVFNTKTLLDNLKALLPMCKTNTQKSIQLKVTKNNVVLNAIKNDDSIISSRNLSDVVCDDDITMHFNINFLLDVVKYANNDTLTVTYADNVKSMTIEDGNKVIVLMPLR